MDDDSQFGTATATDDEIDFRPAQSLKIATPDVVGKYARDNGVSIGASMRALRAQGYQHMSFEAAGVPAPDYLHPTGAAPRPATLQNSPAPQQSPDDAIDFRPAQGSLRSTSSEPDDEIDFQPKTPAPTFSSIYSPPQTGPSLTRRAARMGQPSPDVSAFAPKTADLTSVPRSPFTNAYEPFPGIRTEAASPHLAPFASLVRTGSN